MDDQAAIQRSNDPDGLSYYDRANGRVRICMLLSEPFPPDIRVEKETRALSTAGHRITLLCHAEAGRPTRERIDGDDVVRLLIEETYAGVVGSLRRSRYLLTRVSPLWKRALERVLVTDGIDAIHVHDLPLAKTALAVGERCDLPVVLDLHENYPAAVRQWRRTAAANRSGRSLDPRRLVGRLLTTDVRLRRLERRCVGRADQVLTVTVEAKNALLALWRDEPNIETT
jgi:hypothetical protein